MGEQRVFVWDLSTRLFHWLLAAAVTGAVVTGLQGGALMDWHGRFGLSIVGLLAFRLVWGFVGRPTPALFNSFRRPAKSRLTGAANGAAKDTTHSERSQCSGCSRC